MQIHNLSDANSILNTFISEIRDVVVQKDSMRFRRNIERIGEVLAYEMSKSLSFKSSTIETPLGKCAINLFEKRYCIMFYFKSWSTFASRAS